MNISPVRPRGTSEKHSGRPGPLTRSVAFFLISREVGEVHSRYTATQSTGTQRVLSGHPGMGLTVQVLSCGRLIAQAQVVNAERPHFRTDQRCHNVGTVYTRCSFCHSAERWNDIWTADITGASLFCKIRQNCLDIGLNPCIMSAVDSGWERRLFGAGS